MWIRIDRVCIALLLLALITLMMKPMVTEGAPLTKTAITTEIKATSTNEGQNPTNTNTPSQTSDTPKDPSPKKTTEPLNPSPKDDVTNTNGGQSTTNTNTAPQTLDTPTDPSPKKTTEPTTQNDPATTTKPTTTTTMAPKTDKVAVFFKWTFFTVVGIVALVSLYLVVLKIRRNHCGNQYNRLRNEGRLAMGEFNASSQSLIMNIPNSNF